MVFRGMFIVNNKSMSRLDFIFPLKYRRSCTDFNLKAYEQHLKILYLLKSR